MAYPDPGPPPRRPTPPEPERLSPDWAAAQRREESQLNRPLRAAFAVAAALGLVLVALGAAGSLGALLTGLGVTCCALIAAVSGYALWQGERALRSRVAGERARIGRAREAQESRLFAGQAEHAAQLQEWQVRRLAYERQKRWYAVRVPPDAHRTDIAGGTLSGWSAMLTTAAASQLAAAGEITVLDLTGAAVALDLLGVARARGADPLVWVLPGDLPRLNLTGGLSREALADLWSAVAAAVGEPGPAGDPSLDRARVLESRLRKLTTAGTAFVPPPRSALRVIALDQRVGAASSRMLGTYLTVALTHLLHGDPRHGDPRHGDPRHGARPGQHTLFVLGADKLRGDTLDRLSDACERSATGLVLAYQGIPAHVRPRLGRGNAVVAFMRLAGAEDARAASEELGTGHHLVLSQLTETIGGLVSDTSGGVYTSMASAPSTGGTSTGGTSTGGTSTGGTSGSGSEADAAAVRTSTAWGMATAKATADGESFGQALERSRELLAEPDGLQHLPASAMIIRYAGPGGSQVLLADVNPGIGGLAAATGLTLGEFRAQPAGETPDPAAAADGDASPPGAAPPSPVPGRPAPNVGPPPRRLDWRRGRF